MILPEHIGKAKLQQFGVPVPWGLVASSADEAFAIAQELGTPAAIKAQVPTGRRGKAGGIRFALTPEEAREASGGLLGSSLLGHPIRSVLVEERADIRQEMYLSLTVDAGRGNHLAIFSPRGGVEVEELAASDQSSIHKLAIDPLTGLPADLEAMTLFREMADAERLRQLLADLYDAYVQMDCILAEVNPLALTADGRLMALDCKIEVDDNALYRHPDLQQIKYQGMDERERRADDLGVTYVALDGDVAVVGSGAGLGMATLDIIRLAGMEPANFLDTGGGVTRDLVYGAVRLVLEPEHVRGGMINLYGGINPMVAAAQGIVTALEEDEGLRKPLVVKVLGNQQEEAWGLLERAGIPVVKTVRTEDAARELAAMLGGRRDEHPA